MLCNCIIHAKLFHKKSFSKKLQYNSILQISQWNLQNYQLPMQWLFELKNVGHPKFQILQIDTKRPSSTTLHSIEAQHNWRLLDIKSNIEHPLDVLVIVKIRATGPQSVSFDVMFPSMALTINRFDDVRCSFSSLFTIGYSSGFKSKESVTETSSIRLNFVKPLQVCWCAYLTKT